MKNAFINIFNGFLINCHPNNLKIIQYSTIKKIKSTRFLKNILNFSKKFRFFLKRKDKGLKYKHLMRIIFSEHSEESMIERNISREEILETIMYPDKLTKKYGTYYYQKKLARGILEIPCEKKESIIKIITLYWK